MAEEQQIDTTSKKSFRFVAVLVFVVLAALSVGGFWATRASARDDEERLLHERAGEVAAILTSSTNGVSSALRLLGEVFAGRGESGPGFVASARSLLTGNVVGIGVAQDVAGGMVVRAVEGGKVAVGEVLSGARAELARRSVEANNLVSGLVEGGADGVLFVFAYGRADGLVVFQESQIDPARPVASTAESPFRELDVVLYRTPQADPESLVLTTTDEVALSGTVDSRQLAVGAERWLLLTAAPEGLVGGHAGALPWIILGGGFGGAFLAAGAVGVLARRREYALALVEERTASLQETLGELEFAREAADAANRSKSVFLSRMSHELRTPLNAVLGFAQLLELDELTDSQRESVSHILKGGQHLLNLINEVLDIARIESGEIALSPEAVLVHEIAEETLDLMRPLAAARSIHLSVDRGGLGDRYVFADRQRLKQILLNLLSNAVKYNRVGGTVAVTTEQTAPTRLRLKVTDSGPGIRAEQLKLLFVPFERLDAGRTDIEGTGIGLALSRRLTEAMGGSLDVESQPGIGSTFSVELPAVEGPVERHKRLNTSNGGEPLPALPTTATRHPVLYIEDNLANLKLVQLIVAQRTDLEIIPAMQGRLGIELARQHRPELILLDLHLPDVGGDEVLQQLRDDPATATIPVIIVSADATSGQIQRLQTAGASAYLTKPFNVRELLRMVDEYLPSAPDEDKPVTSQQSGPDHACDR